jgi:hypothetical protein
VISTPNRDVYDPGHPFHIHEFTPDELREALALRFSEVTLYRQQSHFFSLICDDASFVRTWHSEDLPARLRKLSAEVPGRELYTLAVAGVAPLPELRSLALVGGQFDARGWHDLAFGWQERVLSADAAAAAAERRCLDLEQQLAAVRRDHSAIKKLIRRWR